jgi:hypothetical protein
MVMMMTNDLSSTILYYPTIAVPSGAWLKQALLYWDKIASIVPTDWDGVPVIKYTPEVQTLYDREIFIPVRPESLIHESYRKLHDFEQELMSLIETPEFQELLPPLGQRAFRSKIHKNKVSKALFHFLLERGLVAPELVDERWYKFDRVTANAYMAMLAQHLADLDYIHTVPGTDYGLYQELIYRTQLPDEGIAGLSTRLHHVLPIPRKDVSIQAVLDFRQKRRQELQNFQQVIDDYQHELGQVSCQQDAEYVVRKYQRSFKRKVENLQALFKDAKVSNALGTLETIVKTGSLPAAAALDIELPAEVAIPTMGAIGLLSVGKYHIDRRNARRAALRTSAFSYLYHAEEDEIININD